MRSFPTRRTALFFYGGHGNGKTVFWEFMKKSVVGSKYASVVTSEHLIAPPPFTGELGKVLTIYDDPK